MSVNQTLPFISAIIMIAFSLDVFRRFVRRPAHIHLLVWGIGLAMFGIGSACEALSALFWSPLVFILWYLCGAVMTAGWIGHGTVYLFFHRGWVHALTALLVLGSLLAAVLMVTTPLDGSAFSTAQPLSAQYRSIMPEGAPVRLATPFFNAYGSIALIGGALYSAFLLWRKRVLPNRVVGNILIAAGGLSIGLASTLTRLGAGDLLYLGELVAAVLIYAGFIFASQSPAVEKRALAPGEATL